MTRSSAPNLCCAVVLLAVAPAARAQSRDSLVVRFAAMSAVSGLEDALSDSVAALLPGASRDRAGNVVLARGSGAPVRAVVCPLDEVGYVVGGITLDGYLTLRRVGSTPVGVLFDQALEGQRVTVFGRRGAVPGVVGVRSTHLTRGRVQTDDPPFSLDNAYVDVGVQSLAGAIALGIDVLAPVTRAKTPHRYGPAPGGELVAAPWAAQRAACAALLVAVRRAAAPAGGTTVVVFARRRHFGHDGAGFVQRDRAVDAWLLLGESAPAASPGTGPVESADTVALAGSRRAVTSLRLPTRYPRTTVETVALADVAALEERLVAWLGGGR